MKKQIAESAQKCPHILRILHYIYLNPWYCVSWCWKKEFQTCIAVTLSSLSFFCCSSTKFSIIHAWTWHLVYYFPIPTLSLCWQHSLLPYTISIALSPLEIPNMSLISYEVISTSFSPNLKVWLFLNWVKIFVTTSSYFLHWAYVIFFPISASNSSQKVFFSKGLYQLLLSYLTCTWPSSLPSPPLLLPFGYVLSF